MNSTDELILAVEDYLSAYDVYNNDNSPKTVEQIGDQCVNLVLAEEKLRRVLAKVKKSS